MSWYLNKEERYAHVQRYLTPYQMFCGAASGAVTKTAVAPLERVKILLQLRGMGSAIPGLPPSPSLFGVLKHIIVQEGVTALFKGNMANCVRVIPVYALKFSFNDKFRAIVKRPDQTTRNLTTTQLMVAGTMGGLCQIVITYPLEVVRTRLSLSNASLGGKYNGMIDCLRVTVRTEGWRGLYKGITATILSGAPYTGLQMTSYELVKRQLFLLPHIFLEPKEVDRREAARHADARSSSPSQGAQSSTVVHVPSFSSVPLITSSPPGQQVNMFGKLVAGGISGLVSQTITFPGDTIRRRMQTNGMSGAPKLYTSTWDCTKKIWAKEGARGFMRGASTNVWRCIPGAAIQFATYDTIMTLLGIAVD